MSFYYSKHGCTYVRALNIYRIARDKLPPVAVTRTILSNPTGTFALPCEFVIWPGDPAVTPVIDRGRYWEHRRFGPYPKSRETPRYMPREWELREPKRWRPTWEAEISISTYLVEWWEDCGDDGHTEYRLLGYVELMEDDGWAYVEYLRTRQRWGKGGVAVLNDEDWNEMLRRKRDTNEPEFVEVKE